VAFITTLGLHLELGEGLLAGSARLLLDLQHVETHGLRQRPALADGNHVALLEVKEAGRAVGRHVCVTLLETLILPDVVEVVPAKHHCALHLLGLHDSGQDTATDGHVACERALLVDVGALDRITGSLEAKTDLLPVTKGLAVLLGAQDALLADEDGRLLLERLLILLRHDGG